MIEEDKFQNALYALQGVLIQLRKMAYEKVAYEELAELLDYAEELPRLIATNKDMTQRFENVLSEIADKYKCQYLLQRFEKAPDVW